MSHAAAVGGFGDECGPSWMPIAAALRQQPGQLGLVRARRRLEHRRRRRRTSPPTSDILPTRNPVSTQLTPQRDGSGWSLDVPSPGTGASASPIRGEKDGDSFSVPYYTRVVVPVGALNAPGGRRHQPPSAITPIETRNPARRWSGGISVALADRRVTREPARPTPR